MGPSSRFRPPDDAGFLLVEAVLAVALIALCAGAALTAVVAATHAVAHARAEPALTLTAQNVLTDLRAATAYDPVALAAAAGQSSSFDASEPDAAGTTRSVHIVAGVSRADSGGYLGTVTVSGSDGTTVPVQATLVQEAPAPGSVVSAFPEPSPRSDGRIQL